MSAAPFLSPSTPLFYVFIYTRRPMRAFDCCVCSPCVSPMTWTWLLVGQGTLPPKAVRDNRVGNAINNLLTKMGRCAFLLGTVSLGLSLITGCASGTSSGGSTTPPMTGAVTSTVTVTASPPGSISTAQALSAAVAVASSAGAPAGSVVVSSGNYASFPSLVSGGQAVVSVPAGLLAVGTDTLTANFTPANTASYASAAGTTNVTVLASGAATPVVTASSVTWTDDRGRCDLA
jgi:hypothetical protein